MKNRLPSLTYIAAVAAVAVAAIAALGFQGAQSKFGVIDIDKVVFESQLGTQNAGKLDNAVKARQSLLDFIETNRVATVEQLQKLRTLALKPEPTPADKTELDKVKGEITQSTKEFDVLNQKASPSETERMSLQEYNTRRQNTTAMMQEWSGSFQEELYTMREKMVDDSIKAAELVIKEVAKQQGYDVVFSSKSALYAANDITEAVIKALDAKS
ncbi:MAG: OmpH family outer membrane protein [Fimbriimonadaceae bacterium]